SSNITDIFQQLKDPECLEMFGILKKYIEISKSDLIAPPVPTRPQVRRNESPATIDFGITKGLSNTTVTVIEDLSSDHLPLMFNCNINDYFPPRNNYYKFTNWKKFQELLQNSIAGNPSITTTEEIDAAAAAFSQKIQSTINQSSTSKIFPHAPLPLPAPIKTLVSTKNRLRKRWQQTSDPNVKKEVNKLQKTIKKNPGKP
ncbi:putative RNA-directed DNA polymerase from transposon X-element, partial [Nephila pilipes]